MKVEILGLGCYNCDRLEEAAIDAVAMTGVEAEIVKVTSERAAANYGILRMPGLAIDGRVVSSGAILSADEIGDWLIPGGARPPGGRGWRVVPSRRARFRPRWRSGSHRAGS